MSDNTNILLTIKSVANLFFPTCKVLLFGSRARKDFNEHSDYDLLFIIPEKIDIQLKMQYKSSIRKMLVKYGIIADILIESNEEIQIKRNFLGHIVRTAVRDGVYI